MPVLLTDGPDAGLVSHVGNPNVEQRHIEDGAGWLALTNREVFSVSGPDRLTWLHSLTTQHLENLQPAETTTALILDPQGHIEHVMHAVDDGTTFWAWTEPGRGDDLVAWLDSMRFMMRVQVRRHADLAVVWTGADVATDQGDVVARLTSQIAGGTEFIVPMGERADPQTVQFGNHVDTEPVGVLAWEATRIASGIPRIGLDTDARTIPNEIGLYATHLDKGCYRGQETVARVHNLGRPPRRLTMLMLDGSDAELPGPGSSVILEGRKVGQLGGVAMHHELGPVGLALLKRNVSVDSVLTVDGVAASQTILVDPEVGLHVRPQL